MLPIEADGRLASAKGNLILPTKGVLGLAGGVVMSADHPGTPPGKTTVPAPRPVAREFSHMPTAPRCLPFCMLRGTALCREPLEVVSPLPEGFDDDEGRRLFVRHVGEAACKVVRASLLNYLPCSL